MTEKPIIFSGPMVRAILDGRKSQTRRIVKNLMQDPHDGRWRFGHRYHGVVYDSEDRVKQSDAAVASEYAAYRVGDLLWVRETWSHTGQGVWTVGDARMSLDGKVVYRADEDTPCAGWFPSIHMPKEFARIFLKVTDVRVERLQDISEEDAWAEGCEGSDDDVIGGTSGYSKFARLWIAIHGPGSWEANPWVYALTFERVDRMSKAA